MRKRGYTPETLKFIAIAVMCMLLVDHYVFDGKRSYIENNRTHRPAEERIEEPKPEPAVVKPDYGEFFELLPTPMHEKQEVVVPETPVEPKEKKVEVPKPSVHGAPKIAIIIDDIGMDVKRSREAISLPAPVTLAFLPYAPKTRELAIEGKKNGHTLIIHAPMEAMDSKVSIGPGGLTTAMSAEELGAAFDVMLKSFDGYEGINNHMGSRLTQDKAAMDRIMHTLAEKNLFFVDSKTIQSSVAAQEAAASHVSYAERDVFLDHVETPAFVNKALAEAESLAKKRGYAIAIGHPKDVTMKALKAWIPTLQAKGIELVSVKSLLVKPKKPEPPAEMFPEPAAPAVGPTVSEPVSSAPEIELHPLPEQSPAP